MPQITPEERAAPQPVAPELQEEFFSLFCNAVDNLSDMPISDAWANQWAGRAHDMLLKLDYLRNAALYAVLPEAPKAPETDAARDVLAERRRQIEVEGWTPEHDDEHDAGQLSAAAGSYALAASDKLHPYSQGDGGFDTEPPSIWLWSNDWWKPGEPRRMLVKAGALILAEIERIDRAAPTKEEAPKER
jgi:hypothetical protein